MKRITEITKRDVYELFRDGYIEEGFVIEERVAYPYYGRLKEIEFLEGLYDLEKIGSKDPMYSNGKEDIIKNTINNIKVMTLLAVFTLPAPLTPPPRIFSSCLIKI